MSITGTLDRQASAVEITSIYIDAPMALQYRSRRLSIGASRSIGGVCPQYSIGASLGVMAALSGPGQAASYHKFGLGRGYRTGGTDDGLRSFRGVRNGSGRE